MFSSDQNIKDLKNKDYLKNKKNFVYEMFEIMAKDYDQMNEIISLGKNLKIKKQVIANISIKPDSKVLDICTGTGDMALLIAEHLNAAGNVIGVDFSQKMLDIALHKAKDIKNIQFIKADALNLPFEDNTFDFSIISYGLRNVENLKKCILEMKRVTKEGGYVINLDFGKSKQIINRIFSFYFFNIVPVFRKIIKRDFTLYKYIPVSNADFPDQNKLVEIFKEFGFKEVKNYDFAFGTIAQQIAKV